MGHGQGWGDRPFFPGAYGKYALAWGSECFEIAESVSLEQAAMMDILAVCVHAARAGQVSRGRAVLCLGAGPAGNGIAQASLAMGATSAVLFDRSKIAIDVARRQAFAQIVTPGNTIPELDYGTVFDTIGSAESFDLSLKHLGKGGTLVCLAVHDEPVELNIMRLGSERRLVTSCNFERKDFELALKWLTEARFKLDEWLTRIPLKELPKWFEAVHGGEKGAFKLLVTDFDS
jgi:threonine dehydrogenase-like Zn-dependent dehydrogenase